MISHPMSISMGITSDSGYQQLQQFLKFYKNDGKTSLDDPVDDSVFSLKDYSIQRSPSATLLWIWSNLLPIRTILFAMLLLKSMVLQQNVNMLSSLILWLWQVGMWTLFSHLPHHYHLNHSPLILTCHPFLTLSLITFHHQCVHLHNGFGL